MKVTIYSHNFCVSDYNRYGYQFLKQFGISNFGEVDYRAIRSNKWGAKMGRAPLPTIKRTYAASLNNGREFRFHINCLDMFKEAVSRDSVLRNTIEYELVELYKPTKVEISVLPKYSPREEQVPLVDYLKSPGTSKVLTLRTGGGKMQDVREPVLTPTGWRPIGELVQGDQVITRNGTTSTVLGRYPHYQKKLYTVKTTDGRKTLAGGEHLWGVYLNGQVQRKVISTDEVKALLEKGTRVDIPAMTGWKGFEELKAPAIDPFLFGFLFVTGTRRSNVICTQTHSEHIGELLGNAVTRMCGELTYVESSGWKISQSRFKIDLYSRYLERLARYSFDNMVGNCKPIPDDLLNGSPDTRKALLDGILEALAERGRRIAPTTYRIPNPHIRESVLYLARSLGYDVTINFYENVSRNQVDRRRDYEIDINTDSSGFVEIASVEFSRVADAVCIAIDHPEHLYVTRDFIVTHNTYCALQAASDYNERIVISIEKRFFNLWNEALEKNADPEKDKQILDLVGDNVLYVSGSKELNALMELALEDKLTDIKVIIIASRTLGIYFETYERYGEDAILYYPVLPIHFYELLGAGTRIKDELHLSLHANFTEELYLHIPRSYSLSATLEDGSFKDQILAVMFPMNMRAPASKLVKYIAVTGLMYKLREPDDAVFTIRGSTDYNHNAYEQWILKDPKRKSNYLSIVNNWLAHRYLKIRIPGQRAAIFATSVEMATEMQASLERCYPDLTIARYAASAGDVYNVAREADVLVTTVQSFGTGFDLDGLICSLMTTSINSHNTNVQVLGRLRELRKWPDLTPVFDYLVCEDIPKQIGYHEEKIKQFTHRVKSHLVSYINTKV